MRYVIALAVGLALSVPVWGAVSGVIDRDYTPGHRPGVIVVREEGAPRPDYPDPVFTPAPKGWLPAGVEPRTPARDDGVIHEDEPGWNCATMGNRSCG